MIYAHSHERTILAEKVRKVHDWILFMEHPIVKIRPSSERANVRWKILNNPEWERNVFEKIKKKMSKVIERNQEKIPYLTTDGLYDDIAEKDIYWWTNGFWGGILWQMYHATGEALYRTIAADVENRLEKNLYSYRGMDHDSGFKWLLTAVADYRITGNEKSRDRALIAANSLAGRFNPAGSFIRAWNDDGEGDKAGWAIIDCMMNLPLLYWANEEIHDPRFLQIAQAHADMAMKTFVREDGSVNHIVVFDPATGKVRKFLGGQGYGEGSSWTRGQAWALYGFVLSYLHTGKTEYLHTAKKTAHYFMANIPEGGLIPVDFRQPKEVRWEDGTAAAIAACGLLEIEKCVTENEKEIYHNAAVKMLKALDCEACWNTEKDYMIEKCTAAFHDEKHDFPMMYADYFFMEAIWKLCGQESFMW